MFPKFDPPIIQLHECLTVFYVTVILYRCFMLPGLGPLVVFVCLVFAYFFVIGCVDYFKDVFCDGCLCWVLVVKFFLRFHNVF